MNNAHANSPKENTMSFVPQVTEDIAIQAGMQVVPDGWDFAEPLIDSDWDQAQFRLWNGREFFPALAVNVEITGRKIRWTTGLIRPFVRVRITFVGDCEPDTVTHGNLYLDGKS